MNRIKHKIIDNKYILIAFFASIGLMLLVYLCYDMIPFGDNTILRMDLYHQYGPLFSEYYDILTGNGSLLYSWESGGGGAFLGNFYNYLSSPLSVLIILFGHINMTDAIAFFILIKASLSAGCMCWYFKASDEFKKQNAVTAGFSILYAFCGYFLAYYWNVMWLGAMVMFPLVILGIERIIDRGTIKYYSITLAIAILSNYYMGYMICIFSVLYAIAYYFGKYEAGKKRAVLLIPEGKKKLSPAAKIKNSYLAVSAGKFILGSAIAVLLCAFALLPVYFILKSCSATSGIFPDTVTSYFNFFDFLSNHLASVDPTIRSSGDDVLPNVYCGIITLMLSLLYFFTKSIPAREKLSRFFLLVVLYLSFNINVVNYIWHGFHFPNDLPYRFSYMYSFILITLAVKTLIRIREFNIKDILICGGALSFFIILVEKLADEGMASEKILDETVIISLVFTVIYTVVLTLLLKKEYRVSAVASLLLICMIAEVAAADTEHYNIDQPKSDYTVDYNNYQTVKKSIADSESDKFYRTELTYLRTKMDPCWFGYNGISTFSSMAHETLANLQSNLGLAGNYINSYTYASQTPVYNAMFDLKYIVDNSSAIDPDNPYYTAVSEYGGFKVYKNKYALPLAYCVNSDIRNWTYDADNPFDVQADYFEKATGVSDVFTPLKVTSISYSNIGDYSNELKQGTLVYYKSDETQSASITVTLTALETAESYLYVNSSSVDSIYVTANGESKYQSVDEPYILDLGYLKSGETVTVEIPVSDDSVSGYVDFYAESIDDQKFAEGYEILSKGALNITSFENTDIKGNFTCSSDCILYTSITYDTSWDVYIDGNKVNAGDIIKTGNALLGVKVTKGTHEIEFKFKQQGLEEGIIISLVCAAACLTFIIVRGKKKKKKKTTE